MAEQTGFAAWVKRNSPRREELVESRWLKPFAHRIAHSELWRFTRRSVPRGVALGLLVGIFLLVPGVQIIGVVMLALPCRANIPIGAAMTFLSNPATTPLLILPGAIWVGNSMFGLHADVSTFMTLLNEGATASQWMGWIFSDVALGLVAGLLVISVVSAAVGYVLAALFWRWWIGAKWRRRGHGSISVSAIEP